MAGEALELALALHRAPIQRFALRGRPLPADIGNLIQLASGHQALLDEAAQRHGEPAALILDAVRFYLQQVLFDSDVGAYRTLGLTVDAPPERIRQHYRWLQSWLHPDRLGEEWEALYATRVNWAWNQLRNAAAREAYDEQQASIPAAEAETATHLVAQASTGEWRAVPTEPPPISWRNKVLLGVSLGSCAVLLLLVLTREDGAPTEWSAAVPSPPSSVRAPVANGPPTQIEVRPEIATARPQARDTALVDAASALPPPTPAARARAQEAAPVLSHGSLANAPSSRVEVPAAVHTATPAAARAAESPALAVSDSSAAPMPAPAIGEAARVVHTPPANVPPPPARVEIPASVPVQMEASAAGLAAAAAPAIIPPPVVEAPTAASMPTLSRPTLRDTTLVAQAPAPSALPTLPQVDDPPPSAPVRGLPPAAKPAVAATPNTAPDAARHPGHAPTEARKPAPHAAVQEPARVAQAAVSPAVPKPAAPELSVPDPPPAMPRVAAVIPAALPAAPAATPVTPATVPAAAPPAAADMLARVDLARERVRDIVAYFRRPDAAMPGWRDAQAQSTAQRQRDALRDRNGLHDTGRFALDPPVWRMSDETAALDATYHLRGERHVSESGRFSVDMVWSGRAWQVTRIELQPSR